MAGYIWRGVGSWIFTRVEAEMARPEYLICVECEAEVDEFTWRGGEVRAASCEVCGNSDPDAFSLPEEYAQEYDEDDLDQLDELDADDYDVEDDDAFDDLEDDEE